MSKNQALHQLPAIADRRTEVKNALTVLAEKSPQEAAIVRDFVNALATQDIRVLGDNEVFLIRSQDGKAVSIKRAIVLSIADGTLVEVGGGAVAISAQGFEKLAEGANINIIRPPTVLVDNQEQPNPFIRRNEKGQTVEIYCRSVAFGYTATGIPVVSDRTAIFDINLYQMVDLLGKAKFNPDAFKLLPTDLEKPDAAGTWAGYPFDDVTVLWVNTSHKEAINWYAQNTNRKKKAIEFAQTFADRNAVKHHPAIARQKPPDNAKVWRTEVYGWLQVEGKFKWNLNAYAQMAEDAGNLANGEMSGDIEVTKGSDHIGEEENDLAAVMDAEDLAEQRKAEAPEEPIIEQAPEEKHHVASEETWKKLNVAIQFAGEDVFTRAKEGLGITKKFMQMTEQEMVDIINEMNLLADGEG